MSYDFLITVLRIFLVENKKQHQKRRMSVLDEELQKRKAHFSFFNFPWEVSHCI